MNPSLAEGATDFIEDRQQERIYALEADVNLLKAHIVNLKVIVEQLNQRVTRLQKNVKWADEDGARE